MQTEITVRYSPAIAVAQERKDQAVDALLEMEREAGLLQERIAKQRQRVASADKRVVIAIKEQHAAHGEYTGS